MLIVRYAVCAAIALSCCGWSAPDEAASSAPSADVGSRRSEDEGLAKKATRLERAYRHRMARLRRLRGLADESGSEDRVAEVDRLTELANRTHRDRLERCRSRMSDAGRARLEEILREGKSTHREVRRRMTPAEPGDGRELDPRLRRQQIRESARQAAEDRWAEARAQARAETRGGDERALASQRNAVEHWLTEARPKHRGRPHKAGTARRAPDAEERLERTHEVNRWRAAARRNGVLPAHPGRHVGSLPSNGEADVVAGAAITPANVDEELEKLRIEIEQ